MLVPARFVVRHRRRGRAASRVGADDRQRKGIRQMIRAEHTLLLVKPDAVQRGLVGEILARMERVDLQIAALRMLRPTEDLAREHYPNDERQLRRMGEKLCQAAENAGVSIVERFNTADPIQLGEMIFARNVRFLASGRVVAAMLAGVNAVRKVRMLCGPTMPVDALPGTIRGDFSSAGGEQVLWGDGTVRNLVHSSDPDDPGAPSRELTLWFGDSAPGRGPV
jgi:nucleoside-diphosphate kinase